MKLSKKRRLQITRRALSKLACLQNFTDFKLLALGSIGTVYQMEPSAIAKIQILTNPETWLQEIQMQEVFAPNAPTVLSHAIETIGKYKFGTIVMEKMDCTLDVYLGRDLTPSELENIVAQLAGLLEFAKLKELVHGDLAFFNIGVRSDSKLVFIDFDKSKVNADFHHVDLLRIACECYSETRSRGTSPMQTKNVQFLVDHLAWFPSLEPVKIESEWQREFDKYMLI